MKMRTIGVISDTHGQLRPEALAALRSCGLILHAGDVGDPAILGQLGEIAPVHAVRGNTDRGELRDQLPPTAVVDLGSEDGLPQRGALVGPVAYLLHDLEDLDVDPERAGLSVGVSGHTHQPLVERKGKVLFLNPGSAGPRRFSLPVTVALIRVDGGSPDVEIVDLDQPGAEGR
jgi:putative phosphoesterase